MLFYHRVLLNLLRMTNQSNRSKRRFLRERIKILTRITIEGNLSSYITEIEEITIIKVIEITMTEIRVTIGIIMIEGMIRIGHMTEAIHQDIIDSKTIGAGTDKTIEDRRIDLLIDQEIPGSTSPMKVLISHIQERMIDLLNSLMVMAAHRETIRDRMIVNPITEEMKVAIVAGMISIMI
jgi:phosphoribosylformylglycinamidine (FGAM) synthase PurS component